MHICTDYGRFNWAGGDTFLQICLWEAGHAITSPGAGFYDWQMRSFDAGSEDRMGLVDFIMRGIEGTCHDRGLCNVVSPSDLWKLLLSCIHKLIPKQTRREQGNLYQCMAVKML